MMLSRTSETMTTPGELWLLGAFVDAAIPHPAIVRVTDVNLRPELKSAFAVLL